MQRENAAILNAALCPLARATVPAYVAALAELGMPSVPLYFTTNDGTLMPADMVSELPIATFQSGPVNSVRDASIALEGLGLN